MAVRGLYLHTTPWHSSCAGSSVNGKQWLAGPPLIDPPKPTAGKYGDREYGAKMEPTVLMAWEKKKGKISDKRI